MKRWRAPTAKAGQIKVAYGKADIHSAPDICVAWGDGVDMRCTARLIMNAITQENYRPDFAKSGYRAENSLVDELEARGFDITTLKISIERKPLL